MYFLAVLVAWAAAGLGPYYLIEAPGTFGDTFGAINSLFSGFAFVGLIYAIILQQQELGLQREELRLQRAEAEATRLEIKGQKEQAITQNETMKMQTFENMFFQLLKNQNDIVLSFEGPLNANGTPHYRGRDSFRRYYTHLKTEYLGGNVYVNSSEILEKINVYYKQMFFYYEKDVSLYFGSLYYIAEFIDKSDIVEKNKYMRVVRAQLSSNELSLLFYNCLSVFGADKFRPLVEKYQIFHALNAETLISPEHKTLYNHSAFEDVEQP